MEEQTEQVPAQASEQPTPKTSRKYELAFHGSGSEFFKIVIVNWLLTVVTLGIYYPWAKARKLKYMYASTSLDGERFSFHGLGKEMFIGLLKITLFYILAVGLLFGFMRLENPLLTIVGLIVFYLFIFAIIPLAIHGSYRYRMSRSSFRGIRFGYRGDRNELFLDYIKWFLLTLVTFGLYGAWMEINVRNYTLSKIRYGEVEAEYDGDGADFFILNLKGYFFTIFTLGIYSFWWYKDLFNYLIDNLSFHKEDKKIKLNSIATGGRFFKLIMGNLLIVIFTLGLGSAWAEVRTMRFITNNIEVEGDIDLTTVTQTEEEFTDAAGESASDFFDIDLF